MAHLEALPFQEDRKKCTHRCPKREYCADNTLLAPSAETFSSIFDV